MLNKNNLNRGIRPKMGKKSGGSLSGIAPKKTNNPFGRTNARRGNAGIIGKSTQSAFSQNVYGQGNSSEEVDKVSDVKIQIPLKIKLIIIGIVLVISLVMFIVAIFVIIFTGGEEEATVGSSNDDTYYATPKCTNVTLTYTGCDESGENCNVNDGETTFENYIAGTVAAEAGNIENEEYYKLLAITTRTKFYNQYKGNNAINCGTDNSLCSKYMNVEDSPNSEKIKQAVASTEGYVFVENNKSK